MLVKSKNGQTRKLVQVQWIERNFQFVVKIGSSPLFPSGFIPYACNHCFCSFVCSMIILTPSNEHIKNVIEWSIFLIIILFSFVLTVVKVLIISANKTTAGSRIIIIIIFSYLSFLLYFFFCTSQVNLFKILAFSMVFFFFFVVMLSFFFSFSILVTISQGTLGLPKAISWQWVGAENLLTQTKWQNIRINFWNSLIVDIVLCRFEISFKCNSRNYIETWPPSNSVWKSWLALLYFPHLKFAVREVMFRSKLESEWREKTNDLCNINSELNHSLGYETDKNFMNKQRISNVHYGVCIRCVCK